MGPNGMSKKEMKMAERMAKEQARHDAALRKARAIREVQRNSNVSIREAERIAKVQAKLDAKNAREQAKLAHSEAKRMNRQASRTSFDLQQQRRLQAESELEQSRLQEKYILKQAKLDRKTGRALSYEEQYAQYEALQEARAAQVLGSARSGGSAGKVIVVVLLVAVMLAAVAYAFLNQDKIFEMLNGNATPAAKVDNSDAEAKAAQEALEAENKLIREQLATLATDKLDRIKDQNPETLSYIANIANQGFTQAYGWTMQECGIDPLGYAQTMTKGFNYEFSSIMINDDRESASVNVDVKICNIYEFENIVNQKVAAYNDTVEALTATPDQVRARLGQIFLESYSQIQPSNDRISLQYTLEDGAWKLDEPTWTEDIDYLFGLV